MMASDVHALGLMHASENAHDPPSAGRPAMEGYITAVEAARRLCLGKTTIHRWIAQGKLPALRIGRKVYIPIESFYDLVGDVGMRLLRDGDRDI